MRNEALTKPRPRQARPSRIFAKPQRFTGFREGRACPVRNREGFAIALDFIKDENTLSESRVRFA